jgi:DHA1 family bicyclomycin/chloramphenicol resistance-like MFS transporter
VRAAATRVRPGHVLALGGLSCFGPLALDLCLPGLPEMAADLGTTGTAAQLSMSSAMIGLALGQVVVGPLTDRVGRRRILVLGVALFALAAALCAVAPSLPVVLGLRVLGGAGGGAGIVIARSMARDLYEGPSLARIYAMLMMIIGAAPAVASLLAGQLLRIVDWRGVYAVVAAFGVLLTVTAAAQRETLPPERRRHGGESDDERRTRRRRLTDRTFLAPVLALGLGVAGMFTYLTMGSFVLHEFYGLDPESIAWVSVGNGLAIVVASQVSAALSDRVGPAVLLAAGLRLAMASAAAMLVGVALSHQLLALLVPLLLMVGCTGLIIPNATALALDRRGDLAGRSSAVLGLAQFGTAAIVPPLTSLGGISPAVMAATALTTATAAVAVNAFGLRAGAEPREPALAVRTGSTGPQHVLEGRDTWDISAVDTVPLRRHEALPATSPPLAPPPAAPPPASPEPGGAVDDRPWRTPSAPPAAPPAARSRRSTAPATLHWRGDRNDPETEDAVRRLMLDESRRRQWRRDVGWDPPPGPDDRRIDDGGPDVRGPDRPGPLEVDREESVRPPGGGR